MRLAMVSCVQPDCDLGWWAHGIAVADEVCDFEYRNEYTSYREGH